MRTIIPQHELAENPCYYFGLDDAFARDRLAARIADCACIRRIGIHRCVLRRFSHSKPVAPAICRGRIFTGFRADPGRIPGSTGKRADQGTGRQGRDRAGMGIGCHLCAWHRGDAFDRSFYRNRPEIESGRFRCRGSDDAHHVSLHRIHVDGCAVGRKPIASSAPK